MKGEKEMKENEKQTNEGDYPFFIHGDPFQQQNTYPTHTHGLTEVGWPEFFIDPLAFGWIGNARLIHAVYRFLRRPGNGSKLDAVLKGEIVEITDEDLYPGCASDTAYTYCLREANRSFEGVKLAYPNQAEHENIPMQVVQIWVKGDDFALTDEYYKGGIKW
jgi:hypothetical protein